MYKRVGKHPEKPSTPPVADDGIRCCGSVEQMADIVKAGTVAGAFPDAAAVGVYQPAAHMGAAGCK